jgi:hypothetical protein
MEVYDAFGPNQKEYLKAQKLVHCLVCNLCVCVRKNNWDQSQSERTIFDILLPFFFSALLYSIFSDRLLQICAAHKLRGRLAIIRSRSGESGKISLKRIYVSFQR